VKLPKKANARKLDRKPREPIRAGEETASIRRQRKKKEDELDDVDGIYG